MVDDKAVQVVQAQEWQVWFCGSLVVVMALFDIVVIVLMCCVEGW